MDRDGGMLALAGAIRRVDAPAKVAADAEAFLAEYGVHGADAAALLAKGGERFLIYRKLVHNRLRAATRESIPRAVARRGKEPFIADFAAFMEDHACASPYLRDIPAEFVEWVLARWQADPEVPRYLGDLARHELLEADVRNDPDGGEPATGKPVALDAALAFDGSTRLMRYDFAVHRLSYATSDRSDPAEERTHLLVYRDADVKVRYLELTPWAAAVLDRLFTHGDAVQPGLLAAAAALGEALDDDKLGTAAPLFADLAERGVLLGAK
jgi:hypothetical protein